ncbi:MAG: carbon starvation protein A [Gammaproteobacteria bacterium]|nr:MAG: carbon starvation protein A [Gammaproteobacteria bacterium]
MNSLFLLIIAVLAFVFGYRFYSKFLSLGVFRLDINYSTPAHRRTDGDYTFASRHLLFGHHLAAIAAGTTLIGSAVALIWGWIPAFLWMVVGSAVAAGTYGLGSLWLSVRHPGLGAAELAGKFIGPRACELFFLLALALLLIMNAVFALLAAQLFAAYPAAVLPFWTVVLVALVFGQFLRGRREPELIPASLVALLVSIMAVWLLGKVPFAFTGALNLDMRGASFVSMDATFVWMVLMLVYSFFATHLPVRKLVRPHGYLTAVLLGFTLIILYAGVVIEHPNLIAPEFNTPPDGPGVMPWLFITLTSGAFAGFHFLITNGITAKQLNRETDARYVGYGAAVAEGLIALSAVLIAGTAFNSPEAWNQYFASWEGIQGLQPILTLYIDGFVHFAAVLGLGMEFARTLAAVVVISLVVTTLVAGIRVQKHLLAEFAQRHRIIPSEKEGETQTASAPRAPWLARAVAPLQKDKNLLWLTVGLTALLMFSDGQGFGGLKLWPLFGAANLVLGVFGLLLLTLALRRVQQPMVHVLAPMVLLALFASWALIAQLGKWWQTGHWLLFGLGLILLLIELAVILEAVMTLKSRASTPTA